MITPPIHLKRTTLAWLLAGVALPAFAQIPFDPDGASSTSAQATSMAGGIDVVQIKPAVDVVVNAEYGQLDLLYKDTHAYPELAFQETRTTAKLAE